MVGPVRAPMTETEIAEQVRVAYEMAGYARKHCPPEEFDAVFSELLGITAWQRERREKQI